MAEPTHKSMFSIPLVREITFVLLIKLAVIMVIKWQFFSEPVDMSEPKKILEQHMGLTKKTSA